MSYNVKMTLYNNRDYEQTFTIKNPDGTVKDLTDHTLVFGYGSDIKTLGTHTSGAASNKCIFIEDATAGLILLKLPYSILRVLDANTYYHDLILVDADGNRTGVWSGQMIVKRGVA